MTFPDHCPPPHPADLPTDAARRFGSRAAYTLVMPDGANETLSFAEVDRLSDIFAGFLTTTLRTKQGDVVAVQLANGLAFPIVVFGAWKAGLIVTPINPYYTAVETWRQLLDSNARVMVADRSAADLVRGSNNLPDFDMVIVDGAGLPVTAEQNVTPNPLSLGGAERCWAFGETLEGDAAAFRFRHPICLYQYTGGTTGSSKAAIITAANLLATRTMVREFFGSHGSPIANGTALTALPLYHIFAFLFGMLVYVDAGTNNVIVPLARPISNLRPAFEHYAIDWMAGVDTLYAGLLAEDWFRASPPRLKFAIAGGAALRPFVATDWERLVSPLLEGYGLTETTGIVSCNPPTDARRIGSIGFPVTGVDHPHRGRQVRRRLARHGRRAARPGPAGRCRLSRCIDLGRWVRGRLVQDWRHRGHRFDRRAHNQGPKEGHDPGVRIQRLPERGRSSAHLAPAGA